MLDERTIGVCAVLVIFEKRIADSRALAALRTIRSRTEGILRLTKIVVYDNSPQFQSTAGFEPGIEYIADPENGGVGRAYNEAIKIASNNCCEWLLLLDQDSDIDLDFWNKTQEAIEALKRFSDVVAIVPRIWDSGRMVSPSRIFIGDIHRPVPKHLNGIFDYEITAIGSGALVNVSYLVEFGGFDSKYWLDCADRCMFAQMWRSKKKVLVSTASFEHELSTFDYNNRMSEWRYDNILRFEWLFQREFKGRLDHTVLYFRLLFRALKLAITTKNKNYASKTLAHSAVVFRSLFRTYPGQINAGGTRR